MTNPSDKRTPADPRDLEDASAFGPASTPSGRCEEPLRVTPPTSKRPGAVGRTLCGNASHLSGKCW
jgi:hypothetical protein